MSHSSPDTAARERLLQAAGEVFAEHGFASATVRDICSRAATNIAAVNYYFRDKLGLYTEVLRWINEQLDAKHPVLAGVADDAPAPQRLRAFVRSFLLKLFDPERPAWHGKLMSREMFEPTAALDTMVESIRPRFRLLSAIVSELLGPAAAPARVRLCANSVVGQCLHYHFGRNLLARLQPEAAFTPPAVEALIEHIATFSLAAMSRLQVDAEGAAACT